MIPSSRAKYSIIVVYQYRKEALVKGPALKESNFNMRLN